MKLYLKWILIRVLRFLNHIFYVFPVNKRRIYFTSYRGMGLCCNPYYIYRYMSEHYPGKYEYVWEVRHGAIEEDGYIRVKPNTIKAAYYKMTSAVLYSNIGFGSSFPKRKEQIYVNTWHGGGAYKKVGMDLKEEQHPVNQKINKLCASEVDYFVSCSEKFTEYLSGAKQIAKGKFLPSGMPRNDIFFQQDELFKRQLRDKICEQYKMPKDRKIVLYAPTYRDVTHKDTEVLDVSRVLAALGQRFGGEWQMCVRAHHFTRPEDIEETVNVSEYLDMQELLLIADVLITDYSSCMWDFAQTKKPGFLFVPDLEQYKGERDFYTSVDSWPYTYAINNDELRMTILDYSEESGKEKIMRHLQSLKSYEDGKACERVVDAICNRVMI